MYSIQEYEDGGLKVCELRDNSSQSSITVVPERGGIITQLKIGGENILYLNKETLLDRGANIRGGIPILFPISGQLHSGEYELNGQTYKMKNHGFARDLPWEVIATNTEDELSITLKLSSNSMTREAYPFDFTVYYKYILTKDSLVIEQEYINQSQEDMPIYAGFHPYFHSTLKRIPIETDAKTYLDYNDQKVKPFTGTIDLTDKKESLMLLDTMKREVEFPLQEIGKNIKLEYGDEFKYIVCWTEQGKDFVCIEPWMAKTYEFHQKEELLNIKPEETLSTFIKIKVE